MAVLWILTLAATFNQGETSDTAGVTDLLPPVETFCLHFQTLESFSALFPLPCAVRGVSVLRFQRLRASAFTSLRSLCTELVRVCVRARACHVPS